MNDKIYFKNLDAIRSIACLFVLISHILWEPIAEHFSSYNIYSNDIAFFILGNGGFGVRIFFSLSGFLITYLLIKEHQKTGKINLRNFYIRRILRIWPVYFIVIFFVFVVYYILKKILTGDTIIYENPLMSIFFLSNYDLIKILDTPGEYANGILSLTWSVSVEEQFYLFWPLFLFLTPIKYWKNILLLIIGIAIGFSFRNSSNSNLIYHHTVSNFMFLGLGATIAYIVGAPNNIKKYLQRVSITLCWLILISGFLFIVFARRPLFDVNGGIVFYFLATAVIISFFIYNQVADVPRPFNVGNTSWLVNMGKYTYGLYMYHRIALYLSTLIITKINLFDNKLIADIIIIIITIIGSFLFSILSYKYIESPLLKLKDKFSNFRKN